MTKEITIAVTGGIAAYKTCDLVRTLYKDGYPVRVIMTENATHFVNPLTFEALSGKPVLINEYGHGMPHIDIKNHAAVFAIVPATANTIGKIANGIADDLVSSTYLALSCPIIVAPAMNPNMYAKKSVQRNLDTLRDDGVHIIEPMEGVVACGDYGSGKLAEIDAIYKEIVRYYHQVIVI
jgi:phosphopantothenoylcysteine decarboxylase